MSEMTDGTHTVHAGGAMMMQTLMVDRKFEGAAGAASREDRRKLLITERQIAMSPGPPILSFPYCNIS